MRSEKSVNPTRTVHAKARPLGLDDDPRQEITESITGKCSCSEMGAIHLKAVLMELDKLRPSDTATRRKLKALSISGWRLGTRDPKDVREADDRLKAWLRRVVGMEWPAGLGRAGGDAAAVLEARCRILGRPGPEGMHALSATALNPLIASRGERVRTLQDTQVTA
ncbi:MAG: hypothetical protein OXU42_03955 [Deltaproteobacteria bacterium]|nr:hypothetical protein [Deltaproteobacteria bacterium]